MKDSQVLVVLPAKQSKLFLPLANECVSAGFPSPADDYIDIGIDLNEYLIQHPESTFLLRVSGDSMTGAGIHNGDLLVVDRSLNPRPGHIVIAVLDGAFTLKRLVLKNGVLYLEAEHPNYLPIDLQQYENVQIWGVAVHSIHNLKSITSSK
nr:translesion error-prone DNA polymerase V autoproteolytic subunit [Prochlorococcus sp. MIT 1307]